jgi:hypothetical protein
MFQSPSTQRFQLVSTLTHIREEWQEAAGSSSLIEVEGNVGMLLADVINGVGLRHDERIQVLGADLFREMQDFLNSPAHN